jgi:hypothetical protein
MGRACRQTSSSQDLTLAPYPAIKRLNRLVYSTQVGGLPFSGKLPERTPKRFVEGTKKDKWPQVWFLTVQWDPSYSDLVQHYP